MRCLFARPAALLGLLLVMPMVPAPAVASEAVYESLGADGIMNYTNRPAPGAAAVLALPSVAEARTNSPAGTRRRAASTQVKQMMPQLERLIAVVAHRHGVDPHLVRAVIEVESGFNTNARSPAGAAGLMQLMPATAARYKAIDRSDPAQNIDAGTRYLRDLLTMFGGDTRLALAGYNAGEGAVMKYRWRIPPYEETQRYVPSVLSALQRNRVDPSIPRLVASTPPR